MRSRENGGGDSNRRRIRIDTPPYPIGAVLLVLMKGSTATIAALLLAGCGSTTYEVTTRPAGPLSGYGRAEVRDVRVDLQNAPEFEWKESSASDAAWIRDRLREQIADEDLFTGAGPALRIESRVIRYEAVWSDPKLWGGGGSMTSATLVLEIRLLDERGLDVGRAEARGHSVKKGWGLASMNAARRRAVDAAMNFLRDHASP